VSSSTSSTDRPGGIVAGRVGRPHGLDGSFRVTRPRPELLGAGAVVEVAGAEREVVRRAGTDERPIVRLDGCEDRDAAMALRGEELRVARAEAPALDADEFSAEELEGCEVRDGAAAVGVVRRLVALPSCEALEVAREDDDDLLVPLVRDAVRGIDPAARRIDVDLRFLGVE
jgi:16S rRNA processing protein RimM